MLKIRNVQYLFVAVLSVICTGSATSSAQAQTGKRLEREYPKEIRGYELKRASIETKRSRDRSGPNEILTLGDAIVVNVSPLGVTLEIPIVVSAVKQKGRVDFLSFSDITINGTPVTVDDYNASFELPTKHSLILGEHITVFVAMPSALIGAVRDWASPRETWPVTGVVYVFGSFKKSLFSFKRVVPVELDIQMRNPLRAAQ